MQFASTTSWHCAELTQEEWDELVVLKNAISYCPSSVHPVKMERFTQLFARTLAGKGDPAIR